MRTFLRHLFNYINANATRDVHTLMKSQEHIRESLIASTTSKKFLINMCLICLFISLFLIWKTNKKEHLNFSVNRHFSRMTGRFCSLNIYECLRTSIYSLYISFYNVNIEEILVKDLKSYKSINDFFIRKIDMSLRKPDNTGILSSPCDGKILSISELLDNRELIIVKGCTYNILDFLYGNNKKALTNFDNLEFMTCKTKKFYQITIYLSPGDCHRYYSPGDITVNKRFHIPGELMPVKPSFVNKLPNTFQTNERVTLKCKLNSEKNTTTKNIEEENTLFISFVGAFNVGSIHLNFDDFLKTNQQYAKLPYPDSNNIKYGDLVHANNPLKTPCIIIL